MNSFEKKKKKKRSMNDTRRRIVHEAKWGDLSTVAAAVFVSGADADVGYFTLQGISLTINCGFCADPLSF